MFSANTLRWDVRLSPHKLSLLALVRAYVDQGELWSGRLECRHALGLFLSDEINVPSDASEKDLPTLCEELESLPDGDTMSNILIRMLETLESPDHIVDFFTDLSELIEQREELAVASEIRLDRTSLLGLFVRKMMWAFNRMQFDGLSRLWSELEQYKDVDRGSFRGSLSSVEAEKFASALLNKLGTNWGRQHTRPDMDAMIASIKALNPTVSRTHVLSFLNCLIHRDFGGAVDSMHQYFDYSLLSRVQEQQIAMLSVPTDQGAAASFTSFLPYATLNLASIHLRFGHKMEALELIHETIRLVQERTDDACLTMSLYQLQAMAASNGASQLQFDLLKQCLARSIELMMPMTGTETLLEMSNHYLTHTREQPTLQSSSGGASALSSIQPAASFDHLQASMRAALQGDIEASQKVINGVLMQWSGLFELLGQTDVSALYTRAAASHDDVSAHIRMANQYASYGDFRLALRILLEADRKFNPHRNEGVGPRASPEWQIAVRQILFDWCLYRRDFEAAELHALQLAALARVEAGFSGQVESQLRLALVRMQQKEYDQAFSILTRLLLDEPSSEKPPTKSQTRALLLTTLAEVLMESGNGLAAIPHILNALSLCDSYRIEGLRLSATLLLAEIHLEYLHATERARELIVAEQANIRQHGSLALQLRSVFLLAKISMTLPGNKEENLVEAEHLLVQSLGMAQRLESLKFQEKILYFLARVYDELDREDERDEAANLYLTIGSEQSDRRSKDAYFLYVDQLSEMI